MRVYLLIKSLPIPQRWRLASMLWMVTVYNMFCIAQEDDIIIIKRVEFGSAINMPAVSDMLETPEDNLTARFDQTVFPPEIETVYARSVSRRSLISFCASFRGLQNSMLIYKEEKSGPSGYENSMFRDTLLIRANAVHLGSELRIYKRRSHIQGFYCAPALSVVCVFSKVHPLITHEYQDLSDPNNPFSYKTVLVREPWKQVNYFTGLSFALGGTKHLGKRMLIDFGVRSTVYFGKYKETFNTSYDVTQPVVVKEYYDYEQAMRPLVKRMALANVLRQHYLETYLKLGYEF